MSYHDGKFRPDDSGCTHGWVDDSEPCVYCRAEKAEAEVERLKAEADTLHWCKWREDEDGTWWTDCENGYVFIEGGVNENRLIFCPYCGSHIEVCKYQEE